jgi:hypothetical protein
MVFVVKNVLFSYLRVSAMTSKLVHSSLSVNYVIKYFKQIYDMAFPLVY